MEQELADSAELSAADRDRLALWAIRVGLGKEWTQPGSFLRTHVVLLEKRIKAADTAAMNAQKAASHQAAKEGAAAYLRGGHSLSQICAEFKVSERTLVRALGRARKAQTGTNQQPT